MWKWMDKHFCLFHILKYTYCSTIFTLYYIWCVAETYLCPIIHYIFWPMLQIPRILMFTASFYYLMLPIYTPSYTHKSQPHWSICYFDFQFCWAMMNKAHGETLSNMCYPYSSHSINLTQHIKGQGLRCMFTSHWYSCKTLSYLHSIATLLEWG